MWRMCIHTHIWLRRLYMNYRCYQITLRVKHFYTNQERCEVLTGYLSLGRWPGGDWADMWHWTKRFTVFFWNRKQKQIQLLRHFLIAFLEENFIKKNIIIILGINYIIMICINDNEWINNNYGRLPDHVLFFQIPTGTRKDFFEICRQFGLRPPKSFVSPVPRC
jgi:hypothetical protein